MINKVADILGIKVDEYFTANNGRTYTLNSDGELFVLENGFYVKTGQSLSDLLSGKLKKVWKPNMYDQYYTIDLVLDTMLFIDTWDNFTTDRRRLRRGLVFKTKEEAQEKLDEILKILD